MKEQYFLKRQIFKMSCYDETLVIIPVVLLTLMFLWSYYIYVVEMGLKMIKSRTKQICYLFFFNIIFIMLLWSFFGTIFTQHEEVPDVFSPPFATREMIRLARNDKEINLLLTAYCDKHGIRVKMRTVQGYIRYRTNFK